MGYVFNQNDMRSELQQKVAAELTERTKKKAEVSDLPDGVDDSEYLKGTKTTTSLLGVWIGLAAAAAILLIIFVIVKMQQ